MIDGGTSGSITRVDFAGDKQLVEIAFDAVRGCAQRIRSSCSAGSFVASARAATQRTRCRDRRRSDAASAPRAHTPAVLAQARMPTRLPSRSRGAADASALIHVDIGMPELPVRKRRDRHAARLFAKAQHAHREAAIPGVGIFLPSASATRSPRSDRPRRRIGGRCRCRLAKCRHIFLHDDDFYPQPVTATSAGAAARALQRDQDFCSTPRGADYNLFSRHLLLGQTGAARSVN